MICSRRELIGVKVHGLELHHQEKGLQRIFVIIPLALAGLMLWIVSLLRSILRSVGKGTPFTRENASRLKLLGLLVMAAGPFYGILEYVSGALTKLQIDIPGAEVSAHADIRITYVAVGLIILVIGQIFQYGVNLREDSELTI